MLYVALLSPRAAVKGGILERTGQCILSGPASWGSRSDIVDGTEKISVINSFCFHRYFCTFKYLFVHMSKRQSSCLVDKVLGREIQSSNSVRVWSSSESLLKVTCSSSCRLPSQKVSVASYNPNKIARKCLKILLNEDLINSLNTELVIIHQSIKYIHNKVS